MASNVTLARVVTADTTVADTLKVAWDATTGGESDFRVLIQVTTTSAGTQWFVHEATANDRSWNLDYHTHTGNRYSQLWRVWNGAADANVDDNDQLTVTAADLNKGVTVAVEWLQGTLSNTPDDPDTHNVWKRSDATSVPAVAGNGGG